MPPHSSPSTVVLVVTEGSGLFVGGEGGARLGAGETVVYAPGETHAVEAGKGGVRFLAFLTPRPA